MEVYKMRKILFTILLLVLIPVFAYGGSTRYFGYAKSVLDCYWGFLGTKVNQAQL